MENKTKETGSNDLIYFLVSLCLFIVMALLTTDTTAYASR